MIPYQIRDVFFRQSQEETQGMLEAAKKTLQEETDALEPGVAFIQWDLIDQLDGKFGHNINLEAGER